MLGRQVVSCNWGAGAAWPFQPKGASARECLGLVDCRVWGTESLTGGTEPGRSLESLLTLSLTWRGPARAGAGQVHFEPSPCGDGLLGLGCGVVGWVCTGRER